MRLAVVVVGVLAEDEDLGVGIGRKREGGEHVRVGREDGVGGALGGDEGQELGPVDFVSFGGELFAPAGRDGRGHRIGSIRRKALATN